MTCFIVKIYDNVHYGMTFGAGNDIRFWCGDDYAIGDALDVNSSVNNIGTSFEQGG